MSLARGAATIKSFADNMPDGPGVYRMINKQGEFLYIGKAKSLKKRVISYTRTDQLPTRLQRMVAETVDMTFTHTETEAEALLLEATLINSHQPRYNILFIDDKSFPLLVIDLTHDFPSIAKHRGQREKGKRYYGPFASGLAVNNTLLDIQRGFQLRNCTDSYFAARTRPCLQYHIKRCTAPCVNYVSREEYAAQVAETAQFLEGDTSTLTDKIRDQMMAASAAQDYERAGRLRDRLQAITYVRSSNIVAQQIVQDADIIVMARRADACVVTLFMVRGFRNYGHANFYPRHSEFETDSAVIERFLAQYYGAHEVPKQILMSVVLDDQDMVQDALCVRAGRKVEIIVPARGEKLKLVQWCQRTADAALAMNLAHTKASKEILASFAELADLDAPPGRIEIYDNSHIQGAFRVGAYVVYQNGGFDKKQYRTYNIKTTEQGDDFAMMREVLMRRAKRVGAGDTVPDVLLIDGGKGQLSQVTAMLDEYWPDDIPMPCIIAVAKGPDRNAGREVLHMTSGAEIRLPHDDPLLHFIQRLRDEAHRFVIGRHRSKREKAIEINALDDIPNVGASRKKALLMHFGSAKAVRTAAIEELAKVEGISTRLAEQIYKYFNE